MSKDGRTPQSLDVSGTVSGLSGSCPDVRFALGNRTVVADANTDDANKDSCDELRNGVRAVKGWLQPNGTVLAQQIDLRRDG